LNPILKYGGCWGNRCARVRGPWERYADSKTHAKFTVSAKTISQRTNKNESFVQYPPSKLQSEGYTGPVTISNYQKFEWLRNELKKEGAHLTMPTGN